MARAARYVGGLALGALGLVLMLRAGLGAAPWEVGIDGLARLTGRSVSAVRYVVVVAFLVTAVLLGARVRPALITTGLLWASFAAVYELILPSVEGESARVVTFAAGLVVLSVGVAVYLHADLGAGPADAVIARLVERTSAPVWLVRSGFELVGFAVGVALGGRAGPGSLVYAIAVGPLVAAVMRALGSPPRVDETAVLGGGGLVPVPSAPRGPALRRALVRIRRRPTRLPLPAEV